MSLIETSIDNGQREIKQKESAQEHNGQKEYINVVRIGLLVHLLYVGPPLQGDALEHRKKWIHDVVHVGNAEVGVLILLSTEKACWASLATATYDVFLVRDACGDVYTPLL